MENAVGSGSMALAGGSGRQGDGAGHMAGVILVEGVMSGLVRSFGWRIFTRSGCKKEGFLGQKVARSRP